MSKRCVRTWAWLSIGCCAGLFSVTNELKAAISPGDMNCDGVVNGSDIPLFVNCLLTGNCGTGLVDCDGNTANGCETNTQTNVNHCGACNNVCNLANATAACVNGVCVIGSCNVGFADCNSIVADGCEVNMAGNPSHCGGCNIPCPPRANATVTCVNGVCGYICSPGFFDCNGNPSDGCEVNVLTDNNNCGGCNLPCFRPNAQTACVNGVCQIVACNPGWGNCDGNPINGCETNLTNSVINCNACGLVCPNRPNSTPTCNAGVCGINCNPNFRNCDGNNVNGCEINILTDSNNCGNCGVVCPTGQTCVNGVCQ